MGISEVIVEVLVATCESMGLKVVFDKVGDAERETFEAGVSTSSRFPRPSPPRRPSSKPPGADLGVGVDLGAVRIDVGDGLDGFEVGLVTGVGFDVVDDTTDLRKRTAFDAITSLSFTLRRR